MTHDSDSAELPCQSARASYESPVLRPLGDLRQLTLGRSVGVVESSNTNTRFQ